ncbi:MAG: KpsF/GutQ family sugar-phosphate isomerase [Acidobacteriota bacterium]|nr:KpsF/GutQ family sugar-phosphate isomerase [Acidobacteriota bacterium]
MPNKPPAPTGPSDVVRIEARALLELAIRLDGPMREPFRRAVDAVVDCVAEGHRVILLGVGKSGLIARKIAGTMRSTGTPAHFLHPAEALHGDLGMISPGDVLALLSASGETDELLVLLPALRRLGNVMISLCGSPASTVAQASAVTLNCSVTTEACAMNLAPTASTTVMLALGDALSLEVSSVRGFEAADFASLHPGGRLGRRLARVGDRMHTGAALPSVSPETPMAEVIHEMSHKKLGMTTVLAPAPPEPKSTARRGIDLYAAGRAEESGGRRLLGMISDGDLRRLLERDGPRALAHTAEEIMNRHPVTIGPEAFASEALALMEERKITSLIVVGPEQDAVGVVHLHDLWSSAG